MRCGFDADALIYAADPAHPFGPAIRRVIVAEGMEPFGSVLLLHEVLAKPTRLGLDQDIAQLDQLLVRLQLIEVSTPLARLAAELGARHGLKTVDAVHLATAVWAGADVFVTNNRRDFRADEITEVDVRYPDQLPAG